MKLSWTLTAVIVFAGWFFYQSQERQLDGINENIITAQTTLRSLGLDLDEAAAGRITPAKMPPEALAASKGVADTPEQASKLESTRKFARELIDLGLEMKAQQGGAAKPDETLKRRIFALIGRFVEMDESAIRLVVEEFKNSTEMDDKMRREMLSFSIMIMSQSDPQAGLRLISEAHQSLESKDGRLDHFISAALANLAKSDPQAALDWANRPENSKLVTAETRNGLIVGIAQTNLPLALELAAKQGENAVKALSKLAEVVPQDSWIKLLETVPADGAAAGQRSELVRTMTRKLAEGSAEAGAAWLDASALSPEDKGLFRDSVSKSLWGKNPAPWLNWLAKDENDPEKLRQYARNIVPQWTDLDYNATGKWIDQQPQGPLREEATHSFAKTLAPHEPEAASVWALHLPESPSRKELLQDIRSRWKAKDAAASDAFAAQHGLK